MHTKKSKGFLYSVVGQGRIAGSMDYSRRLISVHGGMIQVPSLGRLAGVYICVIGHTVLLGCYRGTNGALRIAQAQPDATGLLLRGFLEAWKLVTFLHACHPPHSGILQRHHLGIRLCRDMQVIFSPK